MKKGMALEGYILEDGTTRPMKQYDDTELRAKIQANTDKIDNLQSQTNSIDGRVTYLETHGGAEDPTKADKVVEAVEGNLAGLDDEGNLTDSGYAPSDFAPAAGSTEYAPASGSTNYAAANHSHDIIRSGEYGNAQAHVGTQVLTGDGGRAYVSVSKWIDGVLQLKQAFVQYDNVDNLNRALKTPSSTPEDDATKLITSKAVYDKFLSLGTSHSHPIANVTGLYAALDAKADNPVQLGLEKNMTAGYYYLYDSNGENTNADNIASVKALLAAITSGTFVSCKVLFKLGSGNTYYLLGYVSWAKFSRLGGYSYIIKLNVADKSYKCIIASSSETVSSIADSEFPEKWEVTTLSI